MRVQRLLACALALGCQSTPGPAAPTSAAPAPVAADPAALAPFDAVGDSAPITVAVTPERWAALHAAVTAKAAGLPAPAQRALTRLATPELAVAWALELPPPLSLAGLDPARPWIFALFEPPANGPVGATTALLPSAVDGFPGFRHRAALPARDPQALARRLAEHLGTAGYQAKGSVPSRPDSHRLQNGARWCAIWPADGHVYVEWISHVAQRAGAPAGLSPTGPVGTPARSAALAAASQPAALSVRFEGRHLRAAYTAHGHLQAAQALASVSGQDIVHSLDRAATALLIKAEALMGDDGVDLNAHTLSLAAVGEGVRVVWTAEATAAGHRALAAGAARAGAPLTVKGQPIAQATTALSWPAALDAAEVPPLFARVGASPRELSRAIGECGVGCWWQLLLRAPFGTSAGLLQAVGKLPGGLTRADLPSLVQVVVPGARQLAVAVEIGPVDPGLIRAALAEVRPLREAQLHVLPRGDRKVALLGVGVDPRTVFDLAPAPAVGLGRAQVDLAALSSAAPGVPAEVAAIAAALGPLRLSAQLHPWGVQQVLDLGAAQASPLPAPPKGTALPARRVERLPGAGEAIPPAAQACLTKLALGMGGLSALSYAAPEQRPQLVKRMLAELQPELDCVAAAAPARPVAAGVRRIVARLQAEPPPKAPASAPPSAPPSDSPSAALASQPPTPPPVPAGPRDKAGIQRVIRRHQRQVRYCYERELQKAPTLAGKLVMRLTIAPDGHVASATVSGGEGPMAAVGACMARRAKAMRFPADAKTTTVNYPFVFRAND